jgi:hypothetical protein
LGRARISGVDIEHESLVRQLDEFWCQSRPDSLGDLTRFQEELTRLLPPGAA